MYEQIDIYQYHLPTHSAQHKAISTNTFTYRYGTGKTKHALADISPNHRLEHDILNCVFTIPINLSHFD